MSVNLNPSASMFVRMMGTVRSKLELIRMWLLVVVIR